MKTIELKRIRPIHYKAIDFLELKVDSGSRKVSGYLAAFGNVDSDGDCLMQGCFSKSLQERGPGSQTARKIAFLWMHQMTNPIGKFTKLEENAQGLYFEAEIDKIPDGDRALTQYQSGTLNQHSIGYQYVWDKCQFGDESKGQNPDTFYCSELNLFEGSVVTLGANENTPFTGMKSDSIAELYVKIKAETELALKSLDFGKQFQIKQLIARYIALTEASQEPVKTLPPVAEPLEVDWGKLTQVINQT